MKCPMCGSTNIRVVTSTSKEPHGEIFEQEYLVCNSCDARFDENDQ